MSFPSETPLTYISFSDSFEEHETLATLSSEEVADTLPLAPLTFTLYVVTFLYYKTGKIDYIAFCRRENALKIRKETL